MDPEIKDLVLRSRPIVLELLEAEVNICLGLLGVNSLQELDGSYLRAATALEPSGALSAFPLLSIDERAFY